MSDNERTLLDQIERDKDNARIVALEAEVELLREANQLRIQQLQQLQQQVDILNNKLKVSLPNDDDNAHGRSWNAAERYWIYGPVGP
jgi:hypothetical protein